MILKLTAGGGDKVLVLEGMVVRPVTPGTAEAHVKTMVMTDAGTVYVRETVDEIEEMLSSDGRAL